MKIGVLIGRFQVPQLHAAHIELFNYVCKRNDKVIVLVGVSPVGCSYNNPLDYETRRWMLFNQLQSTFEKTTFIIEPLYDTASDELWSVNVDSIIRMHRNADSITLYGGRDSFIPYYKGGFTTETIPQTKFISGTMIRQETYNEGIMNYDSRRGVIWAVGNQYPSCFCTVDVAILDGNDHIIMGRKKDESKFRFIGGFSSPDSGSYEDDARREVLEETGLIVNRMHYVGSTIIDDWRYRKERNKIKTIFFLTRNPEGNPKAGDDIFEIRRIPYLSLNDKSIVDEHIPLLEMLRPHL